MSAPAPELPCGPNADDRYCARYWEMSAEVDRLSSAYIEAERAIGRLRAAVAELLDNTGLDDAERARWLELAGIDLGPSFADHPDNCVCPGCQTARDEDDYQREQAEEGSRVGLLDSERAAYDEADHHGDEDDG